MRQESYFDLKRRVYHIAQSSVGCSDSDARARGFLDVFDLLVKDHDGACQPKFLTMLSKELIDQGARRTLLDGMAAEYARTAGWMAYMHSEDWRR